MVTQSLCFFSGFLGSSKDFDPLIEELNFEFNKKQLKSPEFDFFDVCQKGRFENLNGSTINPQNNKTHLENPHFLDFWLSSVIDEINKKPRPRVALGYSLGGRLLMRMCSTYPRLFDACIYVSSHWGLESEEEKNQRCLSDSQWAQRLRNYSFQDFLTQWNQQPVFNGSINKVNNLIDWDKDYLARVLEFFSLGTQENYRDFILGAPYSQLIVLGERDTKFVNFYKPYFDNKNLEFKIITDSGHRVLLDKPKELALVTSEFLQRIESCI